MSILCPGYFLKFNSKLDIYLSPFSGSQVSWRTISNCLRLPYSKMRMICPDLAHSTFFKECHFETNQTPTNHAWPPILALTSARSLCCFFSTHSSNATWLVRFPYPFKMPLFTKFPSNYLLSHHLSETVPVKITINLLAIKSNEHFLVFISLDFSVTFDTVNSPSS